MFLKIAASVSFVMFILLQGFACADPAIIEPGDKVQVTVLGASDLSGEAVVSSDGIISLPVVGNYKIGAKTCADAASGLRVLLKKWVREPNVAVSIVAKAQLRVVIAGMVKQTGALPISAKTTLMEAIAATGGADPKADLSRIGILRPGAGAPELIDLKSFIEGKNPNANPVLSDGDTIIVPGQEAAEGRVYVLGDVRKSGSIELRTGMRVREALAEAGGAFETADASSAKLRHQNGEERNLDIIKAMQGDSNENISLAHGDTIFIPSAMGSFNIYGGVQKPGQYPVKGKIHLTDALTMAGGYVARARIKDAKILRAGDNATIPVNIEAVEQRKVADLDVMAGDTIVIPPPRDGNNVWSVISAVGTLGWLLW